MSARESKIYVTEPDFWVRTSRSNCQTANFARNPRQVTDLGTKKGNSKRVPLTKRRAGKILVGGRFLRGSENHRVGFRSGLWLPRFEQMAVDIDGDLN